MLALDVDKMGSAAAQQQRQQQQQQQQQQPQQQHHTLEWHIASYTVPARRGSPAPPPTSPPAKGSSAGAGSSGKSATRTILQGLAGRAAGGELVAVMGPSGAFCFCFCVGVLARL
jgi:hypothetical protein